MEKVSCPICKIEKPLNLEYWKKVDKYFVLGSCKACQLTEKRLTTKIVKQVALPKPRNDYYLKNKQKLLERAKAWNKNNAEKVKARSKIWRAANSNKVKANAKAWRAKNLTKHRAFLSAYSKRVRQATPKWANKKAIIEIYMQTYKLSKMYGIAYQVDHIIPLRGKYVSGLHVEANLQILSAIANLSKGNKFN